MSNQLKGSDEMQRVSIRAHADLVDEFDEFADEQHGSRSEAMRSLMRRACAGSLEAPTPLEPPADDKLATAYEKIVAISNARGIVRPGTAETVVASTLGIDKNEVVPTVLRPLSERGYLNWESNVYGHSAWRIVAYDRGEA